MPAGNARPAFADRLSTSGRRLLSLLVGVLLLVGCAASGLAPQMPSPLTRDELHTFQLRARFSLRHDGQGYLGRLHWRHDEQSDILTISSPLGQALAEIVSDEQGARLTGSDGRQETAATAEDLLQTVVGYPLPLKHLAAWLRGDDTGAAQVTRDDLGRTSSLRHDEWRIDYEYDHDDRHAAPARVLVAGASGLELRLRIEEWQPLTVRQTTGQ